MAVRVTEAHVHMYGRSPFIAHELLKGTCSFPARDEESALYSSRIQEQIRKGKFVTGASKATDLGFLDRSGKKLRAAIAGGADVICNVLACHEVSGLQYEAKADVLQLDGHEYMVKVISSQAVPSSYFITKALFCRFLLKAGDGHGFLRCRESMVYDRLRLTEQKYGEQEQVEKLHQDVAVVLADGSEFFFNSLLVALKR